MKKPQQHFRIAQAARFLRLLRLLQKDQSIHYGEIIACDLQPPALELPVQRRPGGGNLLDQLVADSMHGAHVAKVDTHPVGCVRDLQIAGADLFGRRFVLCLPSERVVVTAVAEVEKATHRHLEIQRRVERPPRRNRQQRV